MLRCVTVLAACAALGVASSAAAPTLAFSPNVELAIDSRELLMAGGLAGLSSHEDVLVRRLEAMSAMASTDAELRAQAQVLFKLYKALNAKEVAAMGSTESAQFEVFYKTVFQQILARVNASKATTSPSSTTTSPSSTSTTSPSSTTSTTSPSSTTSTTSPSSTTSTTSPSSTTSTTSPSSTTKTPSTGTTTTTSTTSPSSTTKAPSTGSTTSTPSFTTKTPTSGTYSAVATTDPTQIAESLSFFTQVYDADLAKQVRALQDNTQNIEAIVQSTKTTDANDPASQFQAPTVLEGVDEGPTTLDGRRLADASNSTTNNVQVLFCDVGGNAIWKWDHTPYDANGPINVTTTVSVNTPTKLCESPTVEVKVTAYQSGCSRQNHPEGCDNVYWKGCGGLTVNRASNRIIVARTGGRSLGLLYYKSVSSSCQGRVVDAITHYKGKRFNSISYAEYAPSGNLYFTDSPFGLATGPADYEGDTLDKSPLRELPFNGVFLLKNGSMKVDLVECAMDRPNKVAFSPKGDTMYITNSRKGNSYVKRFALKADGTVSNSSVFFNFTAHPELKTDEGYADGIKTDADGHIYVAAYKGVYIFSSAGDLIGTLQSNQPVNGVALGGGRMFLSGSFGVVAQATGVSPSLPLPSAKTDC